MRSRTGRRGSIDRGRHVDEDRRHEQDDRPDEDLHRADAPDAREGARRPRHVPEVVDRPEPPEHPEQGDLREDEPPVVGGRQCVDRAELDGGPDHAGQRHDDETERRPAAEPPDDRTLLGARSAAQLDEEPRESAEPDPDRQEVDPLERDVRPGQGRGRGVAHDRVEEHLERRDDPDEPEQHTCATGGCLARKDEQRARSNERHHSGSGVRAEGCSGEIADPDAGVARLRGDEEHGPTGREEPGRPREADEPAAAAPRHD